MPTGAAMAAGRDRARADTGEGGAGNRSGRGDGGGGGGPVTGRTGQVKGGYNPASGLSDRVASAGALGDRFKDYEGRDDTFLNRVGNFLAGAFGFNEINPLTDYDPKAINKDRRADWGFDPAGLIGSVGGMAAGIPFGTGFLADKISSWAGRPLEINLGPSVFGGAFGPETPAPAPAASGPAQTSQETPPGMPELANLGSTNPALYASLMPYLKTRPGFKRLAPQYSQAGAFA